MSDIHPGSPASYEAVSKKLDTITDILLTLARQEEKVVNLTSQDVRHEKRMDGIDVRMTTLEGQFNGPEGIYAKNSRLTAQMAVVILLGVAIINYLFAHIGK